jgi:excisionase family DNA binding protein
VKEQTPVSRMVYTVKESAFALHISQSTMWRMVYEKQIPAVKVRGRVMIRVKELERYPEIQQV